MIHFLTFGAGSQDYLDAVDRITEQACNLDIFSSIRGITDVDLRADTHFWKNHGSFIETSRRGFGYWIWKPYIILKALDILNNGDFLMYLDSGCELDIRYKDEFKDYMKHVEQNGIWGNNVKISNDITYTKRDLSALFDLPREILELGHIQAGVLILKKDPVIMDLVREWVSICDLHYTISDDKSVQPNFPEFIDHRHDQSAFNLILKKRDLYSSAEYKGELHLVRIAQNRSGRSIL